MSESSPKTLETPLCTEDVWRSIIRKEAMNERCMSQGRGEAEIYDMPLFSDESTQKQSGQGLVPCCEAHEGIRGWAAEDNEILQPKCSSAPRFHGRHTLIAVALEARRRDLTKVHESVRGERRTIKCTREVSIQFAPCNIIRGIKIPDSKSRSGITKPFHQPSTSIISESSIRLSSPN